MKTNNNATKPATERYVEYLTPEMAADLLGLKLSRIRNLVFKKEIPYLKIGASIRFNKKVLIEWYESKAKGGSNATI